MKQSLQLRLGQHLTMTPQLQQAIRLLQLSTMELQTEVQQAVESNPMLEMGEDGHDSSAASDDNWQNGENKSEKANETQQSNADESFTSAAETPAERSQDNTESAAADDSNSSLNEIPDELPVDSSWDDVYDGGYTSLAGGAGTEQKSFDYQSGDEKTLRDHLIWQMELTPFSEGDLRIAEAIIDSIDEDGYLTTSLEDLLAGLNGGDEVENSASYELEEVQAVLHRIQSFDPPGIGSRDLRECLVLQLRSLDDDEPYVREARQLVDEYLDLLAGRDYTQLMRKMKMSREELRDTVAVIQSLNPRPGGAVSEAKTEYIIPDVYVRKYEGDWIVELNPEALPRLRINNQYASFIRRADTSKDNVYLKNQLQEARWFIKSIQSRQETLHKVASAIVDRQQGFLEHGEEAMKALVLHDIAEALGMHESTISRVTTRKYMHTPRGIFELKYFFSSHVTTANGGECSATAIRALIKKLVAAENPAKPLSDSKVATILSQQGINVARRTIAKYRESMSIPPSNERKRLV